MNASDFDEAYVLHGMAPTARRRPGNFVVLTLFCLWRFLRLAAAPAARASTTAAPRHWSKCAPVSLLGFALTPQPGLGYPGQPRAGLDGLGKHPATDKIDNTSRQADFRSPVNWEPRGELCLNSLHSLNSMHASANSGKTAALFWRFVSRVYQLHNDQTNNSKPRPFTFSGPPERPLWPATRRRRWRSRPRGSAKGSPDSQQSPARRS